MNWEGIFTYFNGVVAKPNQVKVIVYEDVLSISDPHLPDPKEVFYRLNSCRYTVIREEIHVYLSQSGTEQLIIPINHPAGIALQQKISEGHPGWFRRTYQKRGWWLITVIVAFLFAILWLAFRGLPPLLVKLVPVKQEIVWGDQIFQAVIEESNIDSNGTELLRSFASEYSLSKKYPIQLTLVEDTIANAYAIPGGNIVVHSGLIAALNEPQELFALLSHEATHVNSRHSMQQMMGNLTTGYLLSMIGTNFSDLGSTLVNQAGMLQELSYSRKLEAEADWQGQELMVKNKISPEGMTQLMQSLQASHPNEEIGLSFLSTHPVTKDRIERSKEFSRDHKIIPNALSKQVQNAWEELKKRYP